MNTLGNVSCATCLRGAIAATALWAVGAQHSFAAAIKEPSTVFYGRVIGTGSVQPFVLTEGTLEWTIRRPDGREVPLRARLWPVQDGQFSYRLDVPHEILAQGLTVSDDSVALKTIPETQTIAQIRVNGVLARPSGGSRLTFDTAQVLRGLTHRVDLEVGIAAVDSDGDGLPDWWEKKYGGDLTSGGDADGDGVSNLREYLAGTDPKRDSRRPSLDTTAVLAVRDGTTGLALRASDSDTGPEGLAYTLTQLPATGELRLRNGKMDPASPDIRLSAGSRFTQKDVEQGRLILVHSGSQAAAASIGLSLDDGTPGGVPATATIAVTWVDLSLPGSAAAEGAPVSGGDGTPVPKRVAVVWNASGETMPVVVAAPTTGLSPAEYEGAYSARYGAERPQIILGGFGDDTLAGGMAADLILGGGGKNQLAGGGGADRFVFADAEGQGDVVQDFNPADGDVLDFDLLFAGKSGRLQDYLRVVSDPEGARIQIDSDGAGPVTAGRFVLLKGLAASQIDLSGLAEQGALKAGALTPATRLAIEATQPNAAENGPRTGEVRIWRTGVIAAPLVVQLEVRGSAANGTDFASLPTSVRFEAGEREVVLPITPYADRDSEPGETVEVSLAASPEFEITQGRAVVFIADLVPVVRIEAMEPLATRQPASPAVLLISRDTILDRSLLVRLEFAGGAVNGTDFQTLPKFVMLQPGQATAPVSIVPNSPEGIGTSARSLMVTVLPDASYLVAGSGQAEALLVSERTTFGTWRSRNFPGSSGTSDTFASSDPGAAGISNAQRYAFGMDPKNPERTRMPRAVVRDGHLTVDVWRRAEAMDVVFIPEVSSSLAGWSDGAELVERVVVPEHARNPEVISYRIRRPLAQAPQMFLNVRVEIRP